MTVTCPPCYRSAENESKLVKELESQLEVTCRMPLHHGSRPGLAMRHFVRCSVPQGVRLELVAVQTRETEASSAAASLAAEKQVCGVLSPPRL